MQFLRGTAAQAKSCDIVLQAGQPLYITDQNKLLIGDGKTEIKDLVTSDANVVNNQRSQGVMSICVNSNYMNSYDGSDVVLGSAIKSSTNGPITIDWGDDEIEEVASGMEFKHHYEVRFGGRHFITVRGADILDLGYGSNQGSTRNIRNYFEEFCFPSGFRLKTYGLYFDTSDVPDIYEGLKSITFGDNCILEPDCFKLFWSSDGSNNYMFKPVLNLGSNCTIIDDSLQTDLFSKINVPKNELHMYKKKYPFAWNLSSYEDTTTDMLEAFVKGPFVTIEVICNEEGTQEISFAESLTTENDGLWIDYGDGTPITQDLEHIYIEKPTQSKYSVKMYASDDLHITLGGDGFLPYHQQEYGDVTFHDRWNQLRYGVIQNAIILHDDRIKKLTLELNYIPDEFCAGGTISELVLGPQVKEIGNYSLSALGVSSIVVPETVKFIGYAPFASCTDLKTLVITDTTEIYVSNEGVAQLLGEDCKCNVKLINKRGVRTEYERLKGTGIKSFQMTDKAQAELMKHYNQDLEKKVVYISNKIQQLSNTVEDPLYEYTVTVEYADYTGNSTADVFNELIREALSRFVNQYLKSFTTDTLIQYLDSGEFFSDVYNTYLSKRRLSFQFTSRNQFVPRSLASYIYRNGEVPDYVGDYSTKIFDASLNDPSVHERNIVNFRDFLLDTFDSNTTLTASGDDVYTMQIRDNAVARYITDRLRDKLYSVLAAAGQEVTQGIPLVSACVSVIKILFTDQTTKQTLLSKFGLSSALDTLDEKLYKLCQNISQCTHRDSIQTITFDRDYTQTVLNSVTNPELNSSTIRFTGKGVRECSALNPVGTGEYKASSVINEDSSGIYRLDDIKNGNVLDHGLLTMINNGTATDTMVNNYRQSWLIDLNKNINTTGRKPIVYVSRRLIG